MGRYETPARSVFPAHAKSSFTQHELCLSGFFVQPAQVAQKDVPKTWDELLKPRWKGEILFDESSLEEVIALIAAWGKEKATEYFTRLSQQQLLIRVGRDTPRK